MKARKRVIEGTHGGAAVVRVGFSEDATKAKCRGRRWSQGGGSSRPDSE